MLDKLFKHIHYYYIKPRKGAPPWWLNLLILPTSVISVFFIWQPIKVFEVSKPISFFEKKGDLIAIVERSSFFDGRGHTAWMKVRFNKDTYWCKCNDSICRSRSAGSDRFDVHLLDYAEILLVNYKYCLITKASLGRYNYENSLYYTEKELKEMGPVEVYFLYKIYLGLFLLFYLMFVYNDEADEKLE